MKGAMCIPDEPRCASKSAGWVAACLYVLGMLFGALPAYAGEPRLVVSDGDFPPRDPAKEALGRLLFFDKLLSGNRDIACATCHNPLLAGGDGLSLPLGAGGKGLGPARLPSGDDGSGVPQRIPRHAPALFNLGATEFTTLFLDGHLSLDPAGPGGFHNAEGLTLPPGLDGVLAAQALFPLVSLLEMAGEPGQNPVADAVATGRAEQAWALLAARLRGVEDYVELFKAAYPGIRRPEQVTLVHAVNAIAAFEAAAFRCTDSAFDRHVRGEQRYLSQRALNGLNLFYGTAGCSECHSGPFQTDHRFHAIGMPQIGPGRFDNQPGYFDGLDDFGRAQVTGDEQDRFRFRTPSLRQVALSGPWGHAGAYNDLESVVRHHLDPDRALREYDPGQALLPSRPDLDRLDFLVHSDPVRRQGIADAIELAPVQLDDNQVVALLEFLRSLTDFGCADLRHLIPQRVPSGLPVGD